MNFILLSQLPLKELQLSPCPFSAQKPGRDPGNPGSWLSWGLALGSVASSPRCPPLLSQARAGLGRLCSADAGG